ncbi:subtilisin-like protein [Gloeopeniophorella convolvens]|nr:subtilisin-like protein [Gloeopeniophorella convolvens]
MRALLQLLARRVAEPVGWTKVRRLEADKTLPLRIGMKQQNLHMLDELLMSVSHPDSLDSTVAAIKEWLTGTGFAGDRIRVLPSKGWIEVNATVGEVEYLLGTEYHVYEHTSGAKQLGCHEYSVPDHIRDHVEMIKPTVQLNTRVPEDPRRLRKRANPSHLGQPSGANGPKTNGVKVNAKPTLDECDQFLTPDCLRALYNFYYTPKATDKNSYGIVEFTPQAYLAGDLDLFFKNFSSSLVGKRPTLVSIDGGVLQTSNQTFDDNGESDLDLEYAMTLTNPQPITLLQTGDLIEGASFDNFLDALDGSFCTFEGGDDPDQDGIYPDTEPGGFNGTSCGIIKPPHVLSISYFQDEGTAPHPYAVRQCNEYGKLGLLGTTVLYSSGDSGVAGGGGVCQNSTGLNDPGGGLNEDRFNPAFPASCPYVVAVGATQINSGSTVHDPESASDRVIFSGGGFSDIFPIPSYQQAAVSSFLKTHSPPYSAAHIKLIDIFKARGFPDLSANGANYVTAVNGEFSLTFGTSASSPVVGSMIAMINDARIAAGKGPVGFINPAIYSTKFADAFNDITSGNNPGCGTDGFTAVKGWDPVTGVGTPNFGKLLPLFLSLP